MARGPDIPTSARRPLSEMGLACVSLSQVALAHTRRHKAVRFQLLIQILVTVIY